MPCLSLQLKYRLPFLSLGTNGPKKNHYYFHPPWMILGECYLESALYKGKGYTNIHFIGNHSGTIYFQCHWCFFCQELHIQPPSLASRCPWATPRVRLGQIALIPHLNPPRFFTLPGAVLKLLVIQDFHVQLLSCITAQNVRTRTTVFSACLSMGSCI